MLKINKKQERMKTNKILVVLVSVIFLVGVLSAYQYYYSPSSPQIFSLFNTRFVGNTLQLDINKSGSPYDSLVGYWSFDADNSTTAFDLSGNGNNGIYYGNAISAENGSGYGKSGVFDGGGDYVRVSQLVSYPNGRNNISFGGWVKYNTSNSKRHIFGWWYNKNNNIYTIDGGGSIGACLETTSGYCVNTPAGLNFNDNNWHFFMVTYNGTFFGLYADGNLVASRGLTGNLTSIEEFCMGSYCPTIANRGAYFNGSIDEVMIFNKSLTADEVLAIYNNQSARFNQEGSVSLKQVSLNETYDLINISLNQSSLLGSNVSASLGYWNTSYEYKNYNESGYVEMYRNFSYINVPSSDSLNFGNTTNFSLSVWIRPTSYPPSAYNIIIAKQSATGPGYSFYLAAGGVLRLKLYATNGTSQTYSSPANTILIDNAWHLATVSMDRSDSAKLYMDGALVSTWNISQFYNLNISTGSSFRIGEISSSNQYFWNGSIDEVMVFNRTLSQEEVQQIYNLNRGFYNTSAEGLVSYYSFNSLSARDEMGLNHGTTTIGYSSYVGSLDYFPKYSSSIYDGLVGHWTGDNSANDYSGNGNDGVLTNGVLVNSLGVFNNSFNFDGTNDYVLLDKNKINNLTNISNYPITVSTWINAKTNGSADTGIIAGHGYGWQIVWLNSRPYLYVCNATASCPSIAWGSALNLAEWNFIVAKFNSTHMGISVNEQPFVFSLHNGYREATTTVKIGSRVNYFNGSIDDVMIWNRTLTEDEIKEIYTQGLVNWQSTDETVFTTNTVSFNVSEKIPSGATNLLPKITLKSGLDGFYTPIISGIINLFLLDITSPVVEFNPETIASGTGIQESFNVSANITESNLNRIIYEWNNTNTTFYLDSPEVSLLEDGRYSFLYTQTPPSSVEIINLTIYAIDNQGNVGKTETRTIRGNAPPIINSIYYSPNNLGDLDPNQMIEVLVNVTDQEGNLANVLLQWKNSTQDWEDVENESIYNLTVNDSDSIVGWFNFTPAHEDIFEFRILAVDDIGASSYNNTNISIFYDCTWTSTQDLGEVAGWAENKFVGNLTIVNTGDVQYANNNCSLDFRLNYDLSEGRIFYDGEYIKNLPILRNPVRAGENVTIEINASFGTSVDEEMANITLEEFRGRSNTRLRYSSLLLITNQNGPYLIQSIIENPQSSVYLTPQNFSFNGYLRNVMGTGDDDENNTAYNVSFLWVLPVGFTNNSNSSETYYENISNSSHVYHPLNVSFENLDSMLPGTYTFYLQSSGVDMNGEQIKDANNNSVLTNSFNITFQCYSVSDGIYVSACGTLDGDYVAPPTPGSGGGSGGGGGGAGGSFDKSEATFELVRGEASEFYLTLENKLSSPKKDITVRVSGDNSQYFSVPSTIDLISPNSKKNLTVKITAPSYFPVGQYLIKFDFSGTIAGNSTSPFTETKYVTLRILEISRKDADELLNSSEYLFQEMNNSGFIIKDVNELLSQINSKYNSSDFGAVRDLSKSLEDIYNAAIESNETIAALTVSIAEAEKNGIQVSETKKLLYLAQILFNRGDYLLALEKLKEANLTYNLETKGEFKILYAIKNNPLESLAILISITIVGTGSTLFARAKLLKRKLRVLEEEEKLLLGLMKVIQRDCFENNKMSMEEYESAMMQYEKRLSEVIQDKIRTETQITNLMKLKGKKNALSQEKDRLQNLIMKTQDDYMNKGKLDTRIYGNMLRTYATRLNQIEEELIYMEAKDELKKFTGLKMWRKN